MKKSKIIIFVTIVSFVMVSCLSTSTASTGSRSNSKGEIIIYMHIIEADDYTDYESIAIVTNSSLVTYSVDRYTSESQMLMTLELGTYSINGNNIEITTNKSHFIGIISDNQIVIGEKEYVLTK